MLQQGAIRRAITLMELVVVMIIILALMMLAVPAAVYLVRSQRSVSAGDEVSAALLQTEAITASLREFRGVALRRSNPSLPAGWFDMLEEVVVKYFRLPEEPPPGQAPLLGWAEYPGYVRTSSGRTVFHSRVVSLYVLNSGAWQPDNLLAKSPPLYDTPLGQPGPEQPLYLEFNGQAQSRLIVKLPSSAPDSPLDPPPNDNGERWPKTPPPDESRDWIWDPNNYTLGWQLTSDQPVLQTHQVMISRSVSQLHLQRPNTNQSPLVSNYRIYSLCPMPTNYQAETKQFAPNRRFLKEPTAIDLSRSIPNQYPTPAAYYPSGTPIIVFGPERSVVLPGNSFLGDKTINGWIVFWVGLYSQDASGNFVMRPEDSTLVGVHVHTGKVGTFRVNTDTSLGDHYYYVRIARQE